MEFVYFLTIYFALSFTFGYVRFRLTHWEDFAEHFETEKRTDLKTVYGIWSEFRKTPKSYPLSNSFLKIAVTNQGLYLQYDLKYEPVKFYKPVLIPWSCIMVVHSEESVKKGCDEFVITNSREQLGTILLQVAVSDKIVEDAKNFGIELNIV